MTFLSSRARIDGPSESGSLLGQEGYQNYDRHYRRAGNVAPDWEAAAARPDRFAWRATWLPADRQARILDFGCGWGQTLLRLWAAGFRNLEGVEISPQQALIAQNGGSQRVRIHCTDGREFLRSRPGSYDVILVLSVLEHFAPNEVPAFLREVLTSLAPGGRAVLRVPNMANLAANWILYSDHTHRSGFTEISLLDAVEEVGFVGGRIVDATPWDLRCWRPWAPLRGLGIRSLLNRLLHHAFYAAIGSQPRPGHVARHLEVHAFRPHRESGEAKDRHGSP